jgi:hypothetical protein
MKRPLLLRRDSVKVDLALWITREPLLECPAHSERPRLAGVNRGVKCTSSRRDGICENTDVLESLNLGRLSDAKRNGKELCIRCSAFASRASHLLNTGVSTEDPGGSNGLELTYEGQTSV